MLWKKIIDISVVSVSQSCHIHWFTCFLTDTFKASHFQDVPPDKTVDISLGLGVLFWFGVNDIWFFIRYFRYGEFKNKSCYITEINDENWPTNIIARKAKVLSEKSTKQACTLQLLFFQKPPSQIATSIGCLSKNLTDKMHKPSTATSLMFSNRWN